MGIFRFLCHRRRQAPCSYLFFGLSFISWDRQEIWNRFCCGHCIRMLWQSDTYRNLSRRSWSVPTLIMLPFCMTGFFWCIYTWRENRYFPSLIFLGVGALSVSAPWSPTRYHCFWALPPKWAFTAPLFWRSIGFFRQSGRFHRHIGGADGRLPSSWRKFWHRNIWAPSNRSLLLYGSYPLIQPLFCALWQQKKAEVKMEQLGPYRRQRRSFSR